MIVVLGEVMLGALLLGSLSDEEERVNLRVQIGQDIVIAAESSCFGEVKGYFQCRLESELSASLDAGVIPQVAMSLRSAKTRHNDSRLYEGVSSMVTNSIEALINDHIATSFQIPAGVRIGCWVGGKANSIHAFGAALFELPNLAADASRFAALHGQTATILLLSSR